MAPRLVGGDAVWLIDKVQTGFRQLKESFRHCIDKIHSPYTVTTMSRHGQDRVQTDPYTYTVHGLDTDTMVQSQSKHVQDTNGVDMLQTQFRHSPGMFQTHPDTF